MFHVIIVCVVYDASSALEEKRGKKSAKNYANNNWIQQHSNYSNIHKNLLDYTNGSKLLISVINQQPNK